MAFVYDDRISSSVQYIFVKKDGSLFQCSLGDTTHAVYN